MKYIQNYESFKTGGETGHVNEEFLGAIARGIKNLFQKGAALVNKIRGGKEIEAIYQKYLDQIQDQFKKTANVDLNISAAGKGMPQGTGGTSGTAGAAGTSGTAGAAGTSGTAGAAGTSGTAGAKKESVSYEGAGKVFEADQNAKLAVDTLKKKKAIMDQIVAKLKEVAMKEMDAVLNKFGGAAKNPQLAAILQTKKDQFDLDYLNSQLAYLDAAGDKTMAPEIIKKRDAISKDIEAKMKEIENLKPADYKEGDEVIYLLKGKKPEDYKKDKKPEDQKSVVGVHKIVKIEGDTFTLEDEKGQPTIKKEIEEIMGRTEGSGESEFKEGDTVIYLLKDKKKTDWDALSDEEKANPGEGKAAEIVGVKPIEKVDGDDFVFLDKDGNPTIKKTKEEIVGKGKTAPVEGQEDLTKKLGDMKSENPESLKKVASYVDFISDEKNKDKAAEIDRIIGEGGEEKEA